TSAAEAAVGIIRQPLCVVLRTGKDTANRRAARIGRFEEKRRFGRGRRRRSHLRHCRTLDLRAEAPTPGFTVCCSRASDSGPVPFSQNFFVTCHCAGGM